MPTRFQRIATTPTDVAWLLTQSQAQRGRKVQMRSTCATYAEWVQACFGGAPNTHEQLIRVPYPEPTPVTVTIGLNGNGSAADAWVNKLYGFPWLTGVVPVASQVCGTVLISWICAGASFAVMVDAGANAISIPACDQVTVEYWSFLPNSQPMLSVAILPAYMPGAVSTLTRAPVVVPAGGFVMGLFQQSFTRRWKLTAAANPDPAPNVPPVAFGPLVMRKRGTGQAAETINFQPVAANGIAPNMQGWIEAGGGEVDQILNNLGAVDVLAKTIEQVSVC
jgi:hypothetical protein